MSDPPRPPARFPADPAPAIRRWNAGQMQLAAAYGTCFCGSPRNSRLIDEGDGNMRMEGYCTGDDSHRCW